MILVINFIIWSLFPNTINPIYAFLTGSIFFNFYEIKKMQNDKYKFLLTLTILFIIIEFLITLPYEPFISLLCVFISIIIHYIFTSLNK